MMGGREGKGIGGGVHSQHAYEVGLMCKHSMNAKPTDMFNGRQYKTFTYVEQLSGDSIENN